MLGAHFPPPPLGPSEGRAAPCTFQIPDGSYRCLALEAEESSSEDGLQGEVRLVDLEEEGTSQSRANHGTPPLSRAPAIIQPSSCGREARGGFQHSDKTSHDWDVVQARKVMTASASSSPMPRVAQKPGKLISHRKPHWFLIRDGLLELVFLGCFNDYHKLSKMSSSPAVERWEPGPYVYVVPAICQREGKRRKPVSHLVDKKPHSSPLPSVL